MDLLSAIFPNNSKTSISGSRTSNLAHNEGEASDKASSTILKTFETTRPVIDLKTFQNITSIARLSKFWLSKSC